MRKTATDGTSPHSDESSLYFIMAETSWKNDVKLSKIKNEYITRVGLQEWRSEKLHNFI